MSGFDRAWRRYRRARDGESRPSFPRSTSERLAAKIRGPEHLHRWEPVVHWDGCHFYGWRYVCECGYQRELTLERSADDAWSAVWMLDEEGKPMCERCAALMAGAENLPPLEITKPCVSPGESG